MKFDFIISHPKEIKKYALLTTCSATRFLRKADRINEKK